MATDAAPANVKSHIVV